MVGLHVREVKDGTSLVPQEYLPWKEIIGSLQSFGCILTPAHETNTWMLMMLLVLMVLMARQEIRMFQLWISPI